MANQKDQPAAPPDAAWNAHMDDLTRCDDAGCTRNHIAGEGLDRLRDGDAQPEAGETKPETRQRWNAVPRRWITRHFDNGAYGGTLGIEVVAAEAYDAAISRAEAIERETRERLARLTRELEEAKDALVSAMSERNAEMLRARNAEQTNIALREVVEAFRAAERYISYDHFAPCAHYLTECDCGLVIAADAVTKALAALDARKEEK